MIIFLAYEGEGPALNYLDVFINEFEPLLDILQDKNYGDELVSIDIIPLMLDESTIDALGLRGRSVFLRKSNRADIRLSLRYRKFMGAKSLEAKRQTYIEYIIDAIETLRHKVSNEYKFDELVHDVRTLLENADTL